MLDWLKSILGEQYTDEIDSKISAEIGKNFVSKADFNQVNTAKKNAEEEVKARDKQIDELKTAGGFSRRCKSNRGRKCKGAC